MEAFEILTKLSLKELDEKCKSLGLKTYGDKKTRAKRILDHQKAETDRLVAEAEKIEELLSKPLDESLKLDDDTEEDEYENEELHDIPLINNNESNSDSDSIQSTYEQVECSRKRKREKTIYEMHQQFDSELLAKSAIDMSVFVRERLRDTKDGHADLAQWVEQHREVPNNEDEPFVIDAVISVNDLIPIGWYLF